MGSLTAAFFDIVGLLVNKVYLQHWIIVRTFATKMQSLATMGTNDKTSGLRAFLMGFFSITNVFGVRGQQEDSKTDAENIASDWRAVGMDIYNAASKYAAQL